MSEIREYLERFSHLPPYGFLLKHGKDYGVGPETYADERGDQGLCFKNATHLALEDPSLTYVEGKIAVYGAIIDHAWCVSDEGLVIDPTLGPAKDGTFDRIGGYFGVPFITDYVHKACLKNGVYGLLDVYQARKTLPNLIELGLEAGQQWLLDQKKPTRKRKV